MKHSAEIITSGIMIAVIAMMITPFNAIAQQATQLPVLPEAKNNNHLPVETIQNDHLIITTVTKNGQAPEGPIIIIPPNKTAGEENATIITPGENITAENPGNITIIQPGGNVTEIPNGNVTTPDNETVIITPPDRNITETPGNVTVIDPPRPVQLPSTEQACQCQNQTQPSNPIPPVVITPAPGQNVTTQLPESTPTPNPLPPAENQSGLRPSQLPVFPQTPATESNNTQTANNGTGGTTGNETGTGGNNTATTNPVIAIMPGFKQQTVTYHPVNSWVLHA